MKTNENTHKLEEGLAAKIFANDQGSENKA